MLTIYQGRRDGRVRVSKLAVFGLPEESWGTGLTSMFSPCPASHR